MPIPVIRSVMTKPRVIATTGVPRRMMTEVAYIAHTKSGNRNQVIPGARILWMVTMKLIPVKMELKPTTNAPRMVIVMVPCEYMLESGV